MHDAEGPWRRRHLGMGIAVSVGLAAFVCSLASLAVAPALMIAAVAIGLFSRPLTRRAAPAEVDVLCTKGRVTISGGPLINRLIRAKDIIGATTARHGEGNVLSLALRGREGKPIHLELASEDEVKSVCDALGIGHGGFGAVGFSLRARLRDVIEAWTRLLAGGAWAGFAVLMFQGNTHARTVAGMVAVVLVNLVVILGIMRRAATPQLVLRSDGAHEGAGRTWRPIRYDAFADLYAGPDALLAPQLRLQSKPSAWLSDGMSVAERDILVSQLRGASARAFGRAALKDDGPAQLDSLQRNGSSLDGWLGRLDAVAASLTRGEGAYRSGALEAADLWRVAEDPEAVPDLRMAAVRVLAKLDGKAVAVRVAPLLDTVREELVRKRIRVAMEPDGAIVERELFAIEEQERLLALKR